MCGIARYVGMALALGCDVDQSRDLAKSVTVE
jgi:glucosamine 6-phosphate synthetase-like amidotransferase/phosphosugar isomerase protein